MARRPEVGLHAPAVVRTVPMGGPPDPSAAEAAGHRLGELLGDPAAVVLTTSCSAALEASADGLDLRPGDEVVVPAYTFPTSATPFVQRGAVVRFADVDPRTGGVDPADVLAKVGPRTRAVVVMHYGGVGAALEPLLPRLAEAGIDLVEDAAQGIFGAIDDVALGRWGRFGALSFHRTKNVSSIEGGAVVVNRPEDLDRIHAAVDKGTDRVRFDRGLTPSYEWVATGSSLRMPEAATHYLLAELEGAEERQVRRHEVWARYRHELAAWAAEVGVGLPEVPPGRSHPAHLFHLVLPRAVDRSPFAAWCAERGVAAVRHYGSLPASPFGRTIAHPDDTCPVAGDLAARLVRIPLHHALDDDDVDRVLAAVTTAPLRA